MDCVCLHCMVVITRCEALYGGLAIDNGRQKLYYADEAKAGGKVGELSTDGTAHRPLFTGDNNFKPRAVVFDDNNRCYR